MKYLSTIQAAGYTENELRRCVRPGELSRRRICSAGFESALSALSTRLYSTSFEVGILNRIPLKGRYLYSPADYWDMIALRRTAAIVRQFSRYSPPNRAQEVKSIAGVLSTIPRLKTFRCDIKGFFESINFAAAIEAMIAGGLRNESCACHMRKLNARLITDWGHHGLPRGIALSSLVADFSIQEVDTAIQSHPDVLLYSRYVDDILVIHLGTPSTIEDCVRSAVTSSGFQLNESKTYHKLFQNDVIEYLGYALYSGKDEATEIGIAKRKLNRIKTRLILSLLAFLRDRDYPTLVERLRFLTASTRMSSAERSKPIHVGVQHTYRSASKRRILEDLRSLDCFFHGLLCSKRYRLSARVRAALSPPRLDELKRFSFAGAYKAEIIISRSEDLLARVTEAWKNVR